MSTLSSLKLVSVRKPSKPSGLVQRRHKLSNKLKEQLLLAQAQAAGESYALTRQRVIIDPETGLRMEVAGPQELIKTLGALFLGTLNFPPCMPFLSLCGNNQELSFSWRGGFPRFLRLSKDNRVSPPAGV